MDILEQFIRDVAYKFPKGYPDMNDPKDKAMLFELAEIFISEKQVLKEKVDIRLDKRIRPTPPNFSKTLARMTEPKVGAST